MAEEAVSMRLTLHALAEISIRFICTVFPVYLKIIHRNNVCEKYPV